MSSPRSVTLIARTMSPRRAESSMANPEASQGSWTRWLGTQVGLLTGVGLLFHAFGFLAFRTFVVVLEMPDEFIVEGPTTYLLWGAKGLTLVLTFLALGTLLFASIAIVLAVAW